ncbi:hypothetical protein RMATCC62417_11909 [Rhizopus microsporus]|nr:hypothetical protein RMATCC62417_11909 [Rhizopus microsporus]
MNLKQHMLRLKMMTSWIKVSYMHLFNMATNTLCLVSTKVAPWIQRASDIKAEVVVNHELEHKLQQHNEEIIKLIKDVKMKDQALQEADVKINLLEKRMETAKKELEHVKTLEEDLEKSLNQEQMYVEAMENLQAEYDALEAENNMLKKEASKREEKRQSMLRKANFDLTEQEDTTTMQEMAGNYYEMSSQMESLKASIRYLRAENAHLKSLDFVRSLNLELGSNEKPVTTSDDTLKSIARETRVLVKDARVAGASPRVVQLSNDYQNTHWQSRKKSPDYQYQTQQSVLYTLKQRSVQLRNQMNDLQITANTNNKELSIQGSQKLGLVKVPNLLSLQNTNRHCVYLKSATEFERLHSIFIQS